MHMIYNIEARLSDMKARETFKKHLHSHLTTLMSDAFSVPVTYTLPGFV
jgi:hypothetical protein